MGYFRNFLPCLIGGIRTSAELDDIAPGQFLELFILRTQSHRFQRPGDCVQQHISFEWFGEEIIGTDLRSADSHIERRMSANHNHLLFRVFLADQLKHFETVMLATLQPDIQND